MAYLVQSTIKFSMNLVPMLVPTIIVAVTVGDAELLVLFTPWLLMVGIVGAISPTTQSDLLYYKSIFAIDSNNSGSGTVSRSGTVQI